MGRIEDIEQQVEARSPEELAQSLALSGLSASTDQRKQYCSASSPKFPQLD